MKKAQISLEFLFLSLLSISIFLISMYSLINMEKIIFVFYNASKEELFIEKLEHKIYRICYFGGEESFFFDKKLQIENKEKLKVTIENREYFIEKKCENIFIYGIGKEISIKKENNFLNIYLN